MCKTNLGYVMGENGGIAPDLMFRGNINSKSGFGIAYSIGLYGYARIDYKYVLYKSASEVQE